MWCGSIVVIQFAAAEIRRGIKKEEEEEEEGEEETTGQNIMVCTIP